MGPSADLPSIAAYEHEHPSSTDDDEEEEDDEFEFRPLLFPQPRGRTVRRRQRTVTGRRIDVAAHHKACCCNCKVATHHQPPLSHSQSARRAPRNVVAAAPAVKAAEQQPPPRRATTRWHHMAFGSVRVPAAMDMGEIRRRLKARQQTGNDEPSAASWAPWRLIRSLSCKGVEAVAVAAAAAPVRLV